ncbi:hypothetical protein E2C01_070625 [Portunus trituberculatus]|uniref:Uncharacterized protein n=1 Tax=Portunus trituberculatus TaxID=210409 RepID=A0A5B7I5R7_PORTR|nr:hypothetical protein [Portunus trituberculatus]
MEDIEGLGVMFVLYEMCMDNKCDNTSHEDDHLFPMTGSSQPLEPEDSLCSSVVKEYYQCWLKLLANEVNKNSMLLSYSGTSGDGEANVDDVTQSVVSQGVVTWYK